MSIKVCFQPDNITVEAEPGEPILQVAERAGVFIATGCLMGSCHACEVELDEGQAVCACISSIPGDKPELTINIYEDPVW
ncbi:2Fe-2S iron-sulfur cluster binding domain-containing protein [Waterburya agarophytonicola K14]|uniref:2Fe-2S iron-sulfur cluster binding domain-containing protein n=1 Tax=Waterburya agarophytonicola KI4 TaxID=2874699 RepID=A0A964FGW6_9CYAN|nr:2Fe-2S iron-sulfur cluster binding domain-containing protein [Waterburya agarophytonicola]MCC0177029.1 2Fe-2S iron-sulfur cluster binding domain-containing protein [Waterburya agarophytonicola KI4]